MASPMTEPLNREGLGSFPQEAEIPTELGPKRCSRPAIDLRQFGFTGRVSDEAIAEIRAGDRRARLVLTTAHLHWFGR